MKNNLEQHILTYDGKAVSLLSEARMACKEHPHYFEELAALCIDNQPKVSEGATWILKAELEKGTGVPQSTIDEIVASLENIQSWQAALHICQCVDHFNLTPGQAKWLLNWAKPYTTHPRPFLRAWSLHALIVVSMHHPEQANQIPLALKAAEEDSAASVRARGRQLRKKIEATALAGK